MVTEEVNVWKGLFTHKREHFAAIMVLDEQSVWTDDGLTFT